MITMHSISHEGQKYVLEKHPTLQQSMETYHLLYPWYLRKEAPDLLVIACGPLKSEQVISTILP